MELKSGAWSKTYDALCKDFLKKTKGLSLDKKLIAAVEDNKKLLEKAKLVDRLINGFAMARDAQKAPFLEPYKKSVAAAEQEYAKYAKLLQKAAKESGPKDKAKQKGFDKEWTAFLRNTKALSEQPATQIAGMTDEIRDAGTLDKKAEDALKDAQKNSKKIAAPFVPFKKQHERAMEEDALNEKKHRAHQAKAAAEHEAARKLYAAKRAKLLQAAKAEGKALSDGDVLDKLGTPPEESYAAEPYAAVFNKTYVEDFNDDLRGLFEEICEPLVELAKAMKKKGLDMGKEFPKVLPGVVSFPSKNKLKLEDGRAGVHAVLHAAAVHLVRLGPAIDKMPKSKK